MECIKFIMFGFNVVFWLAGAAMLGVGIWLAVDPGAFDALGAAESAGMNNEMWAIAVYTFIGIGALVFLVGFLGCWGACISSDSSVPLWIYSVLVVICILGEITVAVLIGVYWSTVDDGGVEEAMKIHCRTKYQGEDSTDALSTSWNTMQQEWECCGSTGPQDYRGSYYDNLTAAENIYIPKTCCVNYDGGEGDTDTEFADCQGGVSGFYERGCYDALVEFLNDAAPIIIGIACGFAGLQIIGLIFACCLIHKKSDEGKYV